MGLILSPRKAALLLQRTSGTITPNASDFANFR